MLAAVSDSEQLGPSSLDAAHARAGGSHDPVASPARAAQPIACAVCGSACAGQPISYQTVRMALPSFQKAATFVATWSCAACGGWICDVCAKGSFSFDWLWGLRRKSCPSCKKPFQFGPDVTLKSPKLLEFDAARAYLPPRRWGNTVPLAAPENHRYVAIKYSGSSLEALDRCIFSGKRVNREPVEWPFSCPTLVGKTLSVLLFLLIGLTGTTTALRSVNWQEESIGNRAAVVRISLALFLGVVLGLLPLIVIRKHLTLGILAHLPAFYRARRRRARCVLFGVLFYGAFALLVLAAIALSGLSQPPVREPHFHSPATSDRDRDLMMPVGCVLDVLSLVCGLLWFLFWRDYARTCPQAVAINKEAVIVRLPARSPASVEATLSRNDPH